MRKRLLIVSLLMIFQVKSQVQKNDSCTILKKTDGCRMNVDREYVKILEKADYQCYAGNYKKALDYYERALLFRPADQYVRNQVQRMKVYIERGF